MSKNVLVSEDGTLTALIDWDNVHTVPRYIGYSRYPSWITRDWDPNKYGHGIPGCRTENSPKELEYFREIYAAHIKSLLSETFDYSTKSHLFEAVWIAVSSPICLDHIVEKMYFSLNDNEGNPQYLYAVDLAEDEDIDSRVIKGFQELFSIGSITSSEESRGRR
jgi:hypothetical protein